MYQLLNTVYVLTPESYLHADHDTLRLEVKDETKMQIPMHHIGAIFCFGNVMLSPALIHRCAEEGRSIVLFSQFGRFKARIEGPMSGNVLLRRAQHETFSNPEKVLSIAKNIVAGKIQNSRQVILRSARDTKEASEADKLRNTAENLADCLQRLEGMTDLDQVRGVEGEAARRYFDVFELMIFRDREVFKFDGRNRRPPRDPVNAMISFLYALLLNDCVSAAEGVGMDPQIGFLHGLRPGRPALALDLIEELRSIIVDRLALTLINREQVNMKSFICREGGAVQFTEESRKEIVVAFQKRKQEEIQHPALKEKVPVGLIPHLQARIMARHLRADTETYIPYLYR